MTGKKIKLNDPEYYNYLIKVKREIFIMEKIHNYQLQIQELINALIRYFNLINSQTERKEIFRHLSMMLI